MGKELFAIMTVGFASIFWIVVMKLLTTKYYIPGLTEVIQSV